jgi:lipopolysaccharide biosynthesis regulator YciM
MPFDLSPDLVFALILAAAAGWFGSQVLRRKRIEHKPKRTEPFNAQYFAGLNHLLNEQQDKALEVLRHMAEADADTVETQLALGHLYRRRGEMDRAIRVHETVMQREDLPPLMREQASFALGEDYLRAGLLDRAEAYFQGLVERPGHRTAALRSLLNIYEQQGDWQQAIATYQRLAVHTSPANPTAMAHYSCELADQARLANNLPAARDWLHQARAVQRNFPRSALLRAEIALTENDARLAACLCKRVIELHPHLLPMTLPRYVQALRLAGQAMDTADDELRLYAADAAQRARLAYAAIVTDIMDEPYLLSCLPDFLRQDANLGDLVIALTGDLSSLDAPRLQAIAAALSRIFRRTQKFRCVDCGVTTGTHFWQCPGCRSWDTLAPVTRLELSPSSRN